MATNKFQLFDATKANIMSDADYTANTTRQNGVSSGIASPTLHNKLFYQTSLMATAIATLLVNNGHDAPEDITTLLNGFAALMVLRDSNGRAQIATQPSGNTDIINKVYSDTETAAAEAYAANLYNVLRSQAVLYDSNGRAQVAAPAVYNDIARFDTALNVGNWGLIHSYAAAGTYSWTAPDLYGDGRPYKVAVFIGGAGGSGGAAKAKGYAGAAAGGAAGYTKIVFVTVTPGTTYSVVVGSGGASVTTSSNAAVNGNAGGSSSFNGNVANGGAGGSTNISSTNGVDGALGGQSSDAAYNGAPTVTPAMNQPTFSRISGIINYDASRRSTQGTNIFNTLRYLSAGGSVIAGNSFVYSQTGTPVDDGSSGGSSAGFQSSDGPDQAVAGGNGSGNCNGGGGAATYMGAGTISASATSGAGAPGMVLIYARGVL